MTSATTLPMDPAPPNGKTARLLAQLMQIARISALEEMASGFAHELNQPIGAITTYAQAGVRMLSQPGPMVASAIEVLRLISDEALSAGQGIHRIRGQFDSRTFPRETCDLADVLMELRPVLDLLAIRAGLELAFTLEPGLPSVSVDRLRIQHVLFALVQNALEVPRRDSAVPEVRIEVTGDRYGVLTAVIDGGAGVSAEAHENLFRPFYTTKRDGTGLGLASSRAIIEAHDGTIGCENVTGGGTRFWFRLPAASREDIAQ